MVIHFFFLYTCRTNNITNKIQNIRSKINFKAKKTSRNGYRHLVLRNREFRPSNKFIKCRQKLETFTDHDQG